MQRTEPSNAHMGTELGTKPGVDLPSPTVFPPDDPERVKDVEKMR